MVSGPPPWPDGVGLVIEDEGVGLAIEDEGVLDDMERRKEHQSLRVGKI